MCGRIFTKRDDSVAQKRIKRRVVSNWRSMNAVYVCSSEVRGRGARFLPVSLAEQETRGHKARGYGPNSTVDPGRGLDLRVNDYPSIV